MNRILSTSAFHKGIGTQISLKDVSFFDVAQGNKIDTRPPNNISKAAFQKLADYLDFLDTCTKITEIVLGFEESNL